MMIIRPIEQKDLDALYHMAVNAGVGVTTLPANRDQLQDKIERAVKSFNESVSPERGHYLFVLEDTAQSRVVGVCGIEARVGLEDVWYNYRISITVNASADLAIHQQTPTLYLTNDLTNCSEVCSLFLEADYRKGGNGLLLSKSRFMFLADFPQYFSEKVFAEMRGVSDANGNSPFWESLGKKFFSLDFSRADYLTGVGNKAFIAELMPKYPIYVPMLGSEAQRALGQVHENTRPARAMLESEGFNFNGFVDIFDGGPVIEAFTNNIRAVRESTKRHAMVVRHVPSSDELEDDLYMVSNRSFSGFRVGLVRASRIRHDTIDISSELAEQLQICSGDTVRIVSLRDLRSSRK
ncbi:MAG: arginine N-succinyltransferase [Hahellaceae bacterium]|nr:arginine N-succinyltransferase [Hahellaceae bacterium]MCP5168792.1 arginine N-succinyltransferase [Hahellaceae bacterium]